MHGMRSRIALFHSYCACEETPRQTALHEDIRRKLPPQSDECRIANADLYTSGSGASDDEANANTKTKRKFKSSNRRTTRSRRRSRKHVEVQVYDTIAVDVDATYNGK